MNFPVATGQTNPRPDSVVEVQVSTGGMVFFCPQFAEVVVVPPEDAPFVLQEVAQINQFMDDLLNARANFGDAQQRLWATDLKDPVQLAVAEQALADALKREEAARKKVKDELANIPPLNKGGELLELLPMWTRPGQGNNNLPRGFKMTYVRSDKMKNHWRRYKLSNADQPEMKSFLTRDAASGKYRLDQNKFIEDLTNLQLKIKHEWQFIDPEKGRVEWAPDFIKAFNERANFAAPADQDDISEFSGGATLLRAFAGVSASSEVDVSASWREVLALKAKAKGAFKGKAEAGAVLADGVLNAKFYLPCVNGCELFILPEGVAKAAQISDQERTLGHFRAVIEGELRGTCGASVLAEGGLEFVVGADGSQQMRGAPVPRDARQINLPKLNVKANLNTNQELKGELTAFAGASISAKLGGALQWRQPESPNYADFASITPKIDGQAGIGGTAAFGIRFHEGKFKVYAKLGACVGLGAKGGIEAVVGAVQMWEFACWFKHQVVNSGDKMLDYFLGDAFKNFCIICALSIIEGKAIGEYVGQTSGDLEIRLSRIALREPWRIVQAVIMSSNPLLNSIAEVKGYLLRQMQNLYRKSPQTRAEVGSAIERLFEAAQLKAECDNIFQHCSDDFGTKSDAVAARQATERIVGAEFIEAVYARVKTEPSPGYQLVFNDSAVYAWQNGIHLAWNDNAWWAPRRSLA
ncbi:hypothetical protein [Chitiniphilus eburneus]|uniref:Uncharacterized protein n=1 Tax=Chitiniphilus eburneus TaxID=2571148 RepID=A0A4U0Q9D0_9NEIS|nr:hypothetical protein [Chitiniphilus eburneus]TJZ77540.1 hypothetical protein FAZ21_04215 [Chitiniphilus eburneus]